MGRKLNLSNFSEEECKHILDVVHKDFNLRQAEKERLWRIESEVEEDGMKKNVLSKSNDFNQKNCISCFSRFLFFFKPKISCSSCKFFVCKNCAEFEKENNVYFCKPCLKKQALEKQSNDWFYSNVKTKFKRCGSDKVIRSLYKRHFSVDAKSKINFNSTRLSTKRRSMDEEQMTTINDRMRNSAESDENNYLFISEDDEESVPPPRSNQADFRAVDTCIQTETPMELRDAGTMTFSPDSSGSSPDGMSTVSTEGHETDPKFMTRPHNIRILEGEPLVVECKLIGTEPLDVLWFCSCNQVQQLVEDERCELRRHGDTFTLSVFNTTQLDCLEYMCIGVNATGQCAQGFTVTVDKNPHRLKAPEFVVESDGLEIVPEGRESVLRCLVSAYPEPKITVFRNNERLPIDGGKYAIEKRADGSLEYALIIDHVTSEDSGVYNVVATNVAGQSCHSLQLLVQPDGAGIPSSSLESYSCVSNSGDLMRLAEELSRTQSQYTTTATRMLRSADAMSSMQNQLDEMDLALLGLEGEVMDVIKNDDDDSLNNNHNSIVNDILDDYEGLKSSAEAVGMVTSAALELLGSAKEIAMHGVSMDTARESEKMEDEGEEEKKKKEEEEEEEEEESSRHSGDAEFIRHSEMQKRMVSNSLRIPRLQTILCSSSSDQTQRKSNQLCDSSVSYDEDLSLHLLPLEDEDNEEEEEDAEQDSAETIEWHHSENNNIFPPEEESTDEEQEQGKEEENGNVNKNKKRTTEKKNVKKTEEQIYLTSGKVFSLEECIRDLEQQVFEINENTPLEKLSQLENCVAKAVAQVTQSDNEVSEIELEVGRWMDTKKKKKNCFHLEETMEENNCNNN